MEGAVAEENEEMEIVDVVVDTGSRYGMKLRGPWSRGQDYGTRQ